MNNETSSSSATSFVDNGTHVVPATTHIPHIIRRLFMRPVGSVMRIGADGRWTCCPTGWVWSRADLIDGLKGLAAAVSIAVLGVAAMFGFVYGLMALNPDALANMAATSPAASWLASIVSAVHGFGAWLEAFRFADVPAYVESVIHMIGAELA